jgi:GNAT superfamily N-acetyltransferase
MSEFQVVSTHTKYLDDCAEIQRLAYPTLTPNDWFSQEKVARQIKVFPEGQFVVVHVPTDRAVAMCSGLLTYASRYDRRPHSFAEASDHGWIGNHDPNGTHYYGVDMSVKPEFRGHGLARMLYEARKGVCQRLNLRGMIISGTMPGYADWRDKISPHEYVHRVIMGELRDPTLTTQIRNGFVPRMVIERHFEDSVTGGHALFMEWSNPGFLPMPAEHKIPFIVQHSYVAAYRV